MVTRERIEERGDELQGLRERYNRLCAALAFGGGGDSDDRLLQEIHVLTQRIVAVEARRSAEEPAPLETAVPTAAAATHASSSPNRAGNVIAFRVKMKGTADQRPGYLPEFTTPAPTPGTALKSAPLAAPAVAATQSPLEELRSAVVAQGQAILVISARCDKQHARLSEIEERLPATLAGNDVTADVAALRNETENQRQQLVVLATAVHRLARLLASESAPE